MRLSARHLALAALVATAPALALAEDGVAQPQQERRQDPLEPQAQPPAEGLEPAAREDAAREAPREARAIRLRTRIVAAARRLLGRRFRGDCSGFVLSLLRRAGIRPTLPPGRSRSESLFLASRRVETPQPGDLAFFHDTYDRNHDGRANDPYTHVALVEEVEGDVVRLLHRGVRGIERVRMDLAHPSDADTNDAVRVARPGDPPGTRVLAGELFAGFGAVAR